MNFSFNVMRAKPRAPARRSWRPAEHAFVYGLDGGTEVRGVPPRGFPRGGPEPSSGAQDTQDAARGHRGDVAAAEPGSALLRGGKREDWPAGPHRRRPGTWDPGRLAQCPWARARDLDPTGSGGFQPEFKEGRLAAPDPRPEPVPAFSTRGPWATFL